MRRYRDRRARATSSENHGGEPTTRSRAAGRSVSLIAHSSAGVINTWGFAYVGGIVGLFSVSLLYVKARIEPRSATSGRVSIVHLIGAVGPWAIAIAGVCGASLGLGFASLLDSQFFEAAEVDDVVEELCNVRLVGHSPLSSALHDDLDHVIDDLDATVAEQPHRALHEAARSSATSETDWNETVDQLVGALGAANSSGDRSCDGQQ